MTQNYANSTVESDTAYVLYLAMNIVLFVYLLITKQLQQLTIRAHLRKCEKYHI